MVYYVGNNKCLSDMADEIMADGHGWGRHPMQLLFSRRIWRTRLANAATDGQCDHGLLVRSGDN